MMQEFDYTNVLKENEFADIADRLSPNEAAAAMDAVQSLREEQAGQKSQDFNLRILKTGLMQPFCRSLRILQHSPVPD
ncbi:hypothetical protein DXA91_00560 [Clostridium sp. OF09-10]|nr:hypothetical protein DXA91_00560 [Clostridium sp. OF09-10]